MGQVALPQFCAMMAEVLLFNRTCPGAREWIDRAMTLMNANGDMYFAAELYRLAARCEGQRDRPSAAAVICAWRWTSRERKARTYFELRAALDFGPEIIRSGRTAVTAALAAFRNLNPGPKSCAPPLRLVLARAGDLHLST